MNFTEEMIAVAVELLTEFGFSATLTQKSPSTYNPVTLVATENNATIQGLAAFFDPSNSNLTGYEQELTADTIKSGKWMYFQCDTKPETGDVIQHPGGRKFKVEAVTSIGPTVPPVLYRVMTTEI